jgi:hypothetical protein
MRSGFDEAASSCPKLQPVYSTFCGTVAVLGEKLVLPPY